MALLLCVSCLERSEEITIAEDGTVTIEASFDGAARDFAPPVALPSEPEWEIEEQETDTTEEGEAAIKLKASKIIPYGQDLPYSYADPDEQEMDINLQFPTEISIAREGNRTIYDFERTYVARDYASFNLSTSHYWDQELEDRIIENGIFEVSEQDRDDYLEQYIEAFSYYHWRFVDMALGELVGAGKISPEMYREIDVHVWNYLEEEVTPSRILGILGKNEDDIEEAHDELQKEVIENIMHIVASYEPYFEADRDRLDRLRAIKDVDGSDTIGKHDVRIMVNELIDQVIREAMPIDSIMFMTTFSAMYEQLCRTYELTERIGGHKFSVVLHMPGTIIVSNGLRDPEEAGSVEWNFTGEDMRDAPITLRAISVVDK
jgi:hypothetical protein